MVSTWNTLPGVVVEAGVIVASKQFLDGHVDMKGMQGYESHAGRRNLFNLALCSAQTWWAEGSVPEL